MLHQQDEIVCCLHPQLAAGPPNCQRYRAFSQQERTVSGADNKKIFSWGGFFFLTTLLGLQEGKPGKQLLRNIILGKKAFILVLTLITSVSTPS